MMRMCSHENKTTIVNASNSERVVRCLNCGLTIIAKDGKIDRMIVDGVSYQED